jgi:hypothetical protein
MIPIHDKAAAATAAVSDQRKIESRAPKAAEAIGLAWSGCDLPAVPQLLPRSRPLALLPAQSALPSTVRAENQIQDSSNP